MTETGKKGKGTRRTLLRWALLLLFAAGVILCFSLLRGRRCRYTVVEGDRVTVLESYCRDAAEALREGGISLGYGDTLQVFGDGPAYTVKVERSVCVELVIDGAVSLVSTSGRCVRDVLEQVGADYREGDRINCGPGDFVRDGMRIEITTVRVRYVRCEIPVSVDVEYVKNPAAPAGSETVMVPGSSGLDCVVFRDTYVGGVLAGREECGRTAVTLPQARVIELGTGLAGPDQLVLADGRTRALPRREETVDESLRGGENWSGEGDEGDPDAPRETAP